MAIAKNYRKHPEALLQQLELALVDVRDTFEWMRVNKPAAYAAWARVLRSAKRDVRGLVKVPEWVRVAKRLAAALARVVKAAILEIFE